MHPNGISPIPPPKHVSCGPIPIHPRSFHTRPSSPSRQAGGAVHPQYRPSASTDPCPPHHAAPFLSPPGKMAGLTLTPFNAGRMVGGAIWKLALRDGSELLYALDWCHKKER